MNETELDEWFNDNCDNIEIILSNDASGRDDVNDENDEDDDKIIEDVDLEDDEINRNKNDITTTKKTIIEDIILKNVKNLTAYENIKYQYALSYIIQGILDKYINFEFGLDQDKIIDIIEYLTWFSESSHELSKRIGQDVNNYDYNPENKPEIIRSSYNFCEKNVFCKYFYIRKGEPTCKEHHYVHALVKHDVDSVLNFLKYAIKNKIKISKNDYNNIYLSIKTLCFVTKHMENEISRIDNSLKHDSELFHRNNPSEFIKKRTNIKKPTFTGSKNKIIKNSHPLDNKIYVSTNNRFSALSRNL